MEEAQEGNLQWAKDSCDNASPQNHKGQAKAGSATSELPSNRTQKHSLETGTNSRRGNLKLRTAVDLHLTEKRRPCMRQGWFATCQSSTCKK